MTPKFNPGDIIRDEASTDYFLIEEIRPTNGIHFHYHWRNLCNGWIGFWEGSLVDKYAIDFKLVA